MIKTFTHKGLARFFIDNDKSGIPRQFKAKLERLLDRLDAAVVAEDMRLPGFDFHPLVGNRKGTFSVKVSGNWRLTFRFIDGCAIQVNLEDYH